VLLISNPDSQLFQDLIQNQALFHRLTHILASHLAAIQIYAIKNISTLQGRYKANKKVISCLQAKARQLIEMQGVTVEPTLQLL